MTLEIAPAIPEGALAQDKTAPTVYFTEVEADEREYFEEALDGYDLRFVSSLNEVAADVEMLSVFIYSEINAQFLDTHPALRFISTRSTTFDHVDRDECRKRGLKVAGVRTYGNQIVAEHAFALILALARRLRESMNLNDHPFSYETLRGFGLKGRTLGIIGTGRIGLRMIRIARGFGMKIIAFDVVPRPRFVRKLGFNYVSLEELLRRSDIISLHVPLNDSSYHLLDREAFLKCRPGVIIINTARGRLIDTEALVEAMDEGIVAGAGLDVLGEETALRKRAMHILSDQIISRIRSEETLREIGNGAGRSREIKKLMLLGNLLARPNVVFTPHNAFNCVESIDRIHSATVHNIKSFTASLASAVKS